MIDYFLYLTAIVGVILVVSPIVRAILRKSQEK